MLNYSVAELRFFIFRALLSGKNDKYRTCANCMPQIFQNKDFACSNKIYTFALVIL